MKTRFEHFSIRFTTAVLLGLLLMLAQGFLRNPVSAVLAPQCASPWELSKLIFWPLVFSWALTGRLSGGCGRTLRRMAPWLVASPLALMLAGWAIAPLHPAAGFLLVLWVGALALTLLLAQTELLREGPVWMVLAVALGMAYIILTFLPPFGGPFLDPADVAAMAVIPF